MLRIVIEDGKPEQTAFILCDNPRCMRNHAMLIPPGMPEMQAIQTFFGALNRQEWLILPHGHYCPDHKHAFTAAAQTSLIVPAVALPPGMAHLRKAA
jgi:hypothetical protein